MQGSRREPVAWKHSALAFWAIVVTTLAADQITKAIVRNSMTPGESIPLLKGVFHLTYVLNAGAGFGLFPGRRPVFMFTTAIVLLVIAAYWRRSRPTSPFIVVALALITAGAVGNLIDRGLYGLVTDFFDFTLIDFPVFNIADACIVVGVGILIGWLLLTPEPREADAEQTPTAEEPDPGPGHDAESDR